jgi:hypothetical protein
MTNRYRAPTGRLLADSGHSVCSWVLARTIDWSRRTGRVIPQPRLYAST